jgi:hypothetical protein
MHTHTAAEWASAGSLGLSAISLIRLALAFADADGGYFDPRPAVRRTVAATHQQLVHAGHDLNRAVAAFLHAVRSLGHASVEAWRDAVALVLLLTTKPQGAMA